MSVKPLHKDPQKKEMLKWFLLRASHGSAEGQRRAFFDQIIDVEKEKFTDGAMFVLQRLAELSGHPVEHKAAYWAKPPGAAPFLAPASVAIRGYHTAPPSEWSERWDLCWVPSEGIWAFNVDTYAPKRRGRRGGW